MLDAKPGLFGVSTYPIAPPLFGGSLRVFHLARAYAAAFRVSYVTQKLRLPRLLRPERIDVAPDFVEWQGCGFAGAAGSVGTRQLGVPQLAFGWTQGWVPPAARAAQRHARLIVLEQPWSYRWARARRREGQLFVASTHNLESDLFDADRMRMPRALGLFAKRLIATRECEALLGADLVVACAAEDGEAMIERYGVPSERIVVVPNGVDVGSYRLVDPAQRADAKRRLGLEGKRVVVFAGSWHPPNVKAVQEILTIAASWLDPSTQFLIIGSVGRMFAEHRSSNVTFTHLVDDVRPYLEAGDVFLNPMREGSGSNIKLFEAMAAGLPTVSTGFGARGVAVEAERHLRIAPPEAIGEALRSLLDDPVAGVRLRTEARRLVEQRYDWSRLGASLTERLVELSLPDRGDRTFGA